MEKSRNYRMIADDVMLGRDVRIQNCEPTPGQPGAAVDPGAAAGNPASILYSQVEVLEQ